MKRDVARSREKASLDQHVNLKSSRLDWPFGERGGLARLAVLLVCLAIAVLIAGAAWRFAPSITGRLKPWLVPLVLAGSVIAACLVDLATRPSRKVPSFAIDCIETHAVGVRPIIASLLAVVILAFGVRLFGLFPAVWLATTVAALGLGGVKPGRAIVVGAAISLGLCLLFTGLLRQPIPLVQWPQRSVFAPDCTTAGCASRLSGHGRLAPQHEESRHLPSLGVASLGGPLPEVRSKAKPRRTAEFSAISDVQRALLR
jgi:hypothetical protein